MTSLSGVAGASFVATYAATKVFDWLLAEGLHQEWKPRGRRCARRRSRPHRHAPRVLGREPFWVAGEANRAALAMLEGLPRAQRSAGLSLSTLALYAATNAGHLRK